MNPEQKPTSKPDSTPAKPAATPKTEFLTKADAAGKPPGSTPPDNASKPAVAVISAGPSENVASQFVAEELQRAHVSLKRTRVAGCIVMAVVLAYMGFITINIRQFLEPKAAAEIANGILAEQVEAKAADLSLQLQEKIPALIAQLPDYVLLQLPEYRLALEEKIEDDFANYCVSTSQELGRHLDLFLDNHKEEIKALLAVAEDRETVRQLGPDLEQEILSYLQLPPENGESIMEKIDKSLEALKRVETQMARLATAGDLTPQEKKTRRAIAIIAKTVEKRTLETP